MLSQDVHILEHLYVDISSFHVDGGLTVLFMGNILFVGKNCCDSREGTENVFELLWWELILLCRKSIQIRILIVLILLVEP